MERKKLMAELAALVADVVNAQVDPDQPDTKLVEDLGADSMDLVDISDRIEVKFGVVIESEDVKDMKTLGEVGDLVMNKVEQAQEAK